MEGKGVFSGLLEWRPPEATGATKLTALARQVALQSSPQSAKNEIHQKFAVSGVDQDAALSDLWKNDRY